MSEKTANEKKGSSMPGFWKYPTYRDDVLKSDFSWLEGRRQDGGAEGLWRIHDTLYDFTNFVNIHPGGAQWLLLTKGTDITEAFEAHHMSSIPRKMLDTFKVKEAVTQRNSPFTFRDDGFYTTLRKRVFEKLPELQKLRGGPSPQSCRLVDTMMLCAVAFALAAAKFQNIFLAVVSGIFLATAGAATHNFVHLRYNWRRNYMCFMLFNPRHYTTVHILSHHLFPNTLHDLEVSLYEPHFQWLPYTNKGWTRYLSWIISPFVFTFAAPEQYLKILFFHGLGFQEVLPLLLPLSMYAMNTSAVFSNIFILWIVIVFTASFWFQAVGLHAGHHHPDIFHDGDAARIDRDWGLAMVDAVRDRTIISGVTSSHSIDKDGKLKVNIEFKESWLQFFLTLTNYGHHVLHHLFPTVDHYYLPKIYPILEETLQEFGEIYRTTTVIEEIKGQYLQLARRTPNTVRPGFNK